MLILTRNVHESIIIDNNITVTILGVQGRQVRIGIEAPKPMSIHRKEIQQVVDEERRLGIPYVKRPKVAHGR